MAGGGGGGGPFVGRTPEQLVKQVRETEDETAVKEFETELSGIITDLLASANSRDVDKVQERLDEVKDALEGPLENSVDTLFGGSVAKRTYVDGLSDVDSLLILDDSSLEGAAPSEILAKVAEIIQKELGSLAIVTTGKLAVTIRYQGGMELQLLPAFRTKDGLRVPSWLRDGWSNISPQNFQNELTKRNEQCGGKLIPTIKLAKAVIANLPESQRLTGYHVESLAIAAFRDYSGLKTTAAMLPIFFDKARELVTEPIRDSTGQSVHVDDYLGPAGSAQREAASHILSRIGKRMRNASAHQSKEQWRAIFGLTDD
jgi:SMODS domain-containing protein